jgi:AcrR family transcriptional regulator
LFHYFRNKQEFHRAVVRRAADDLIECTAPDMSLDPIPRLVTSLEAYVDYVLANYQGYVSLVRGAAGGDQALLEIFDETRRLMTARITDNLGAFGLADSPTVQLLARGWTAMVEETVLAWVGDQQISKDELLGVLAGALPAILTAAS